MNGGTYYQCAGQARGKFWGLSEPHGSTLPGQLRSLPLERIDLAGQLGVRVRLGWLLQNRIPRGLTPGISHLHEDKEAVAREASTWNLESGSIQIVVPLEKNRPMSLSVSSSK